MITLNNSLGACGTESPSFGSFAVTLQDDESATVALPVDYGHVLVAESSASNHGLAWIRGSSAAKYFGGANLDVMVNTALTGTTGADGKLTISSNGNNFYIENRTGSTISPTFTFLGIAALRT